ncbi:aconitate hydratase, partial [bacterium SM23_31]
MEAQGRGKHWIELKPDVDAEYNDEIKINLDELEPLIAQPHNPDNVVKVKDIEGLEIDQVCVGSCTNSSYQVLSGVAEILKGKVIAPNVSMTVSPGSKQVYEMIAASGDLTNMIRSGVRILESVCGPCIGMGQSPPSGGISIRSFNRNFKGRSGTTDAKVYLCNPFVASAMALEGKVIDPRDKGLHFELKPETQKYAANDNFVIPPPQDPSGITVKRGPNIQPIPVPEPLTDEIEAAIILKTADNISTDDIMPAGSDILPLRSNIPAISEFVFYRVDSTFAKRAKDAGKNIIVGGNNYGQGSSREHAAIAPMYLGIKAVIVKNFARIHRANLVNFGILPLEFDNPEDYDKIEQGDVIRISNIKSQLDNGGKFIVENKRTGDKISVHADFSRRQREILSAGGLLPYIKSKSAD